ncbi:hypothetical protein OOT08_03510, partial [Leucobacter sp. M11]|nr:hypothetical protein [Leucobacter sp. M11]
MIAKPPDPIISNVPPEWGDTPQAAESAELMSEEASLSRYVPFTSPGSPGPLIPPFPEKQVITLSVLEMHVLPVRSVWSPGVTPGNEDEEPLDTAAPELQLSGLPFTALPIPYPPIASSTPIPVRIAAFLVARREDRPMAMPARMSGSQTVRGYEPVSRKSMPAPLP